MQRLRPVASEALSPTTLSALFSRRPRSVLGELEWVEFRYAGLVRLLAPPDQFSIVQSAHQALLRRAVLSRHLPAVAHSYLGRIPRRHRPENIRTIPALDKRVDRMKRSEVWSPRTISVQDLPESEARTISQGKYGIHIESSDDFMTTSLRAAEEICMGLVDLLPSVRCDDLTYTTAIKMASRWASPEVCHQLLNQATERGFTMPMMMWGFLMTSYGRAGRVEDAGRIFSKFESEDCPEIYKAMMSALGEVGDIDGIWNLYLRMKVKEIVPTILVYETVLHFLTKHGRLDNIVTVLQDMREVHRTHPVGPLLVEIVNALGLTHIGESYQLLNLTANDKDQWMLVATTLACVKARSGAAGSVNVILDLIKERGLSLNMQDASFLMSAYAQGGQYARARQMLDEYGEALAANQSSKLRTISNKAVADLIVSAPTCADVIDCLQRVLQLRLLLQSGTIAIVLRQVRQLGTPDELCECERMLMSSPLWPADLYPGMILSLIEANDMVGVMRFLSGPVTSLNLDDRGHCVLRRVRYRLLVATAAIERDRRLRFDLHSFMLFQARIVLLPKNFTVFLDDCIELRQWDMFDLVVEAIWDQRVACPPADLFALRDTIIASGRQPSAEFDGLSQIWNQRGRSRGFIPDEDDELDESGRSLNDDRDEIAPGPLGGIRESASDADASGSEPS
ncbi:unnamed protein product (mitochondrion) [Plasmodiophora brassicae]|uniref:Pentacotripeptide-repeat region of PRORP domain-containing protein n=1 Tax=Plasmodiophora brassicae TaxID=37360 RepID=A0A3P3Y2N1_PLABS|nr:unnamed protein product [Plasmodiophora brassicae]